MSADDPALPFNPFVGFSGTSLAMPSRGDTVTMVWQPVGLEFYAPTRLKIWADDAPEGTAYFIASVNHYNDATGETEHFVLRSFGSGTYSQWRCERYDDGGSLAPRTAISATANVLEAGVKTFTIQTDKAALIGDRWLAHPRGSRQHADCTVIDYDPAGTSFIVKFKASEIYGISPISVDSVDSIDAGGTGYNRGETITLTGGTFSTAAVLTVTNVDEDTGAVTEVEITDAGEYTVFPSDPVAQGSTDGSGTGATFNLTPSNEHDDWEFELIDRAPAGIPAGQISGLRVSTTGTDTTITAGAMRDTTNAVDLVLPSALTKDATDAPWVVGNNQAGVIRKSLAGVITKSVGSDPTVTGVGTAFLTDFKAGSVFSTDAVPHVGYVVGSVTNDTSLELIGTYTPDTFTSEAYSRGGVPQPALVGTDTDDEYLDAIVFRKDADGSVDSGFASFNAADEHDVPTGYTLYGVAARLHYFGNSVVRVDGETDAEFEADAKRSGVVPVLLASGTITNADGEMFFPAGHTSYRDIEIRIFNLIADVDNVSIFGYISTDGSTWKSGATDYNWFKNVMPRTTGVAALTADNSDSELEMATVVGNSTAEIMSGRIRFPDHANASAWAAINWELNYQSTATVPQVSVGYGNYRTAGAISGFRLLSNNADNDLSFDYEIWGYP